jgi:hypothetical protein
MLNKYITKVLVYLIFKNIFLGVILAMIKIKIFNSGIFKDFLFKTY